MKPSIRIRRDPTTFKTVKSQSNRSLQPIMTEIQMRKKIRKLRSKSNKMNLRIRMSSKRLNRHRKSFQIQLKFKWSPCLRLLMLNKISEVIKKTRRKIVNIMIKRILTTKTTTTMMRNLKESISENGALSNTVSAPLIAKTRMMITFKAVAIAIILCSMRIYMTAVIVMKVKRNRKIITKCKIIVMI